MTRRRGGAWRRRPRPAGDAPQGGDLRLGSPLERALRAPLTDMQRGTEELAGVAARMTLPAPDEETLQRLGAAAHGARQELTYLTAQALRRAAPVIGRSGVTPQSLLEGRARQDVLCRARRMAAQAQSLASDGRLMLGAKFTYFFDRLMGWYAARLTDTDRPLEERLALASDFARIDAVRFRLLAQGAGRRTSTAEATPPGADDDAAAFAAARRALEEGRQPDVETLGRALRHAARLELLAGAGRAARPSPGPPKPTADRRDAPRD